MTPSRKVRGPPRTVGNVLQGDPFWGGQGGSGRTKGLGPASRGLSWVVQGPGGRGRGGALACGWPGAAAQQHMGGWKNGSIETCSSYVTKQSSRKRVVALRRTHRDTDGVPALPTHAGPIRPFFECCDDLCRRVRFSDHMARDPLLQAVQADPRQARPHVLETNVVRYPQMK